MHKKCSGVVLFLLVLGLFSSSAFAAILVADSRHDINLAGKLVLYSDPSANLCLKDVLRLRDTDFRSISGFLKNHREGEENAKKQVKEKTGDLQLKSAQLEESLQIEQQARENQSGFIDMISHEYRTPLAILKTRLSVLPVNRFHWKTSCGDYTKK
ncbi:hypothetical protein [uncultured Desulfuromonas sp.]|uniref:hypothetical protein n=1 Tax=uncultured Desulfuromonas sp. TaxID=181013 RepID=UPI002AAADE6E|nr:hypothetical protein [uncultured Desulfuromonas sp.]